MSLTTLGDTVLVPDSPIIPQSFNRLDTVHLSQSLGDSCAVGRANRHGDGHDGRRKARFHATEAVDGYLQDAVSPRNPSLGGGHNVGPRVTWDPDGDESSRC